MFWPCVMLLLLFRSGRNFVCRRFHYDVTLSILQPNNFFVFFKWTRQREKRSACMCTPAVSAAADDYFQSYIYILYTVFLSRGVNSFFRSELCNVSFPYILLGSLHLMKCTFSLSFSVELFRSCFHFSLFPHHRMFFLFCFFKSCVPWWLSNRSCKTKLIFSMSF